MFRLVGRNNPFTETTDSTVSPTDSSNPFFDDLKAAAVASAVARGANPFEQAQPETSKTFLSVFLSDIFKYEPCKF